MFVQLLMLQMCILLQVNSSRFEDILNGSDYDKSLRPLFGIKPMNVTSQIIISTLGPIKEQDMTFELSFFHRQWWNDPRLAQNNGDGENTSYVFSHKMIWLPDIYIVNVREAEYNEHFTRTVVKSNGDVFFSHKVAAKCICNMDLRRYPMDKQTCQLRMESYAFSTKDMHLKWSEKHVDVPKNEKLSLTGYEVIDVSKSENYAFYGDGEFNQFSSILVNFEVKRTSVYYAYKAFLPTLFLTIFNLGSYYIPDDAMPARVTLIITTFLANTFILQSVSDQTVQVSYTTAMQLFLLVNVLFLMTSIVQYLILLNVRKITALKTYIRNSIKRRYSSKNENSFTMDANGGAIHLNENIDGKQTVNTKEKIEENDIVEKQLRNLKTVIKQSEPKKGKTHILDRIFRVLMPFLYLLFCIVYFAYYLH